MTSKQLQSSLIRGVAQTDLAMAKQLADQVSGRAARDQAYSALVRQAARDNPASAVDLVASIQDERMRSAATQNLVNRWVNSDRIAARRWVSGLQPGASRDASILSLTGNMQGADDELYRLISTIEDKEKRSQAKMQYIYQAAGGDITLIRQMMNDPDISDEHREKMEQAFASDRY